MHWYDWHTVTERLQGRVYALTRGRPYKVILDPATSTGACDFANKRILINPNLFNDVFQNQGLSGKTLDKANFLVSRAVTGHEALHVIYSDPEVVMQAASESAILKTVLNILEDARIEMIGSERSHVSKTLFRFVNGVAARLLPAFGDVTLSDPISALSLLLRWRLGAPLPKLEANAVKKGLAVKTLADKALYAPTSAEVLEISRQILSLCGLDKSNVPNDIEDALNRMESRMTGSDSQPKSRNPLQPPEDSQEEDSVEGNCGEVDSDEVADNSAQDDGEGEPADAETLTNTNTDNSAKPDSPDKSQAGNINDDDVNESDADDVKDVIPEDLEKMVEQTAQQASEDLSSLVPPEFDSSSLVAKATAYRGRYYSNVVAAPYANYLSQAAPIAADLVRELRAEAPRGTSGACVSPGRFRTRYYVRDSSRPYSALRFQGLTVPKMALSLVIDRSGSMEHTVDELRTMSMAITMACDSLQIPLSIWALEGQVHVKHFDESGPQVLAKIAGIPADTLTRVMPTMRDAVADIRKRPEELKQIVMIHDGMPSDRLDFINWRNELRGIRLFCLFIMKEEDYVGYQQNPQQMRENMDSLVGPKNYAIAPVTDIARHWCSYIRNIRNRYSSIAH